VAATASAKWWDHAQPSLVSQKRIRLRPPSVQEVGKIHARRE
jgi:hypothetical protein